ncbi:adenosine deaminase [Nonomuraea phyllanthi]|uniref:Adenosine deaminase n=1 Tax=Nonomuraea phyllanthi TaxID=2219224 RepID=A0A5C4WI52_9ACTN|nr:adenosine deaminase [Nonomuraea phyllanthi]KAB8193772.1 adenosine deaminase [Nonomuraea phyllanthi]QFY12513.1 adenosine deaminase [Nonomuraea phyllanthi]
MRLPLAELHLHLEGAIRASTAAELADRHGLPVPPQGPFDGLGAFVTAYERARDLVGSLDDLRRVARELVEDAAAQGVVWSEVHVVPPTYAGRLGPDEAVLEAVLDGFAAGTTEESSAGVIVGVNRGLPPPSAERSLALALAYRDAGVVGFGLAGDEANHRAELFADVFARAREAGLPAVPHGGEGAGADSVRACVEVLGAHRVNHGIRAAEDPGLLRELAERQVCLDVCPSSNVALRITPSTAEHPLPELLSAGVPVTLNSDCPLFCDTSAVREYELARDRFGLDRAALARIAETSLRFSSCPAERRERALAGVARWAAAA